MNIELTFQSVSMGFSPLFLLLYDDDVKFRSILSDERKLSSVSSPRWDCEEREVTHHLFLFKTSSGHLSYFTYSDIFSYLEAAKFGNGRLIETTCVLTNNCT